LRFEDPPALSVSVTVLFLGAPGPLQLVAPAAAVQTVSAPFFTVYGPVPPLQLKVALAPVALALWSVSGDPTAPAVKFAVVVSVAL
jgi:hypothetical protein